MTKFTGRAVSLSAGAVALSLAITPAWGQSVKITPKIGNPKANVAVSGSAFGATEAIDVYFDTTDTLLAVSGAGGAFSGSLTVPASATPGVHYITAIGRRSGVAAQAPFTVQTNWTQFGFGANRLGWNPYENVIGVANAPSLGVLWQTATNGSGGTPAVVGGKVYVSSNSGVEAYSAATGATLWSRPVGLVYSSPTVSGGAVYVLTQLGTVYSLNAATGAINWSKSLEGSAFSSIAVASGTVLAANYFQGALYALSSTTGATL